MLAGNARDSLITRGHDPIDRAHGTAAQGAKFSGRVKVRQQVIEVGAQLPQDVCNRTGIAGQNGCPQARIGRRNAGGISQPLPRQPERLGGGVNKARCEHRRHQLRNVRHESDRMVMRSRVHLEGHGSNVRRQRARHQHSARPRRLVCNDHPRTSVEQVGICGARTAALTTCHRMRTDVTRGFLETSFVLQAA